MRVHTIYIIVGYAGRYDDARQWNAAWRGSPEEAEAVRAAMQAEADAYEAGGEQRDYPQMQMFDRRYVEGAKYYVETVYDAPDAAEEPCRWCDTMLPLGSTYQMHTIQHRANDYNWQEIVGIDHHVAPDNRVEPCPGAKWHAFAMAWWYIAYRANYPRRP